MEVMGQWSDQEPLSPRLATGKSPADYWSICIVIDILLFLFLLCTYLGVCNNNNNNNNVDFRKFHFVTVRRQRSRSVDNVEEEER